MNWFWYSAQPHELFLDIDHYDKAIDHIRKRLQGAIECEKLYISTVHKYHSYSKNHVHIIISLLVPIPSIERFAWETIFHSDIYRGCCNIMRVAYGIDAPDILIAKHKYHREPDAVCDCESKHTRRIMENCPAAFLLRGQNRIRTFFGKPSDNPCKFL